MSIREILKMGDPRLLQVAQPVQQFDTPELHSLITDLFDTVREAQGAGLAAPQIGVNLAVVIFGMASPTRYPNVTPVPETVLINPTITALGDEQESAWEGCLSVPGLRGRVRRFTRIRYTGFNAQGQAIERIAEGFHARVVQHECDHLQGQLYPMRLHDLSQFGFLSSLGL
jgi:peptide deformylase